MGRKIKYRPEYCDEIIDFMSKGYSMGSFAGKIRTTLKTLLDWRKEFKEFDIACEIAVQAALYYHEELLLLKQSGKDSTDQLSEKINLSATIFALKTRFHKIYGNKDKLDISSEDGSMSPKQDLSNVSTENLLKIKELLSGKNK